MTGLSMSGICMHSKYTTFWTAPKTVSVVTVVPSRLNFAAVRIHAQATTHRGHPLTGVSLHLLRTDRVLHGSRKHD